MTTVRGEHTEMWNGDCLDVLRGLPDGYVQACITDPPYNVGVDYGDGTSGDRKKDYPGWCAGWFAELKRVCDGPILITCGTVNLAMWCEIERPRWVLCWHKPAAMGRSPVGFCNWEPVLLYGTPHRGKGGCDVFAAPVVPKDGLDGHPCPKPLQWASWQVRRMTRPGDVVLDPFMGSGTTGVACVRLRRSFVGVESSERYFGMARRRVTSAVWGSGAGFLS